ncbi:MAG: hypothetical protein ACPLRN_03415 [Microgenomates group bacterium]
MLKTIIFELEGDEDLVLNNFLGYETYSFVLKSVAEINTKKSTQYHQKNLKKPFTVLPPFFYKDCIYMRINFLEDEIFSLFLSSIFEKKEIDVKKNFKIKKIFLKPDKNLPSIFKDQLFYYDSLQNETFKKGQKFIIKTITPFLFKKNNQYNLNPTFEVIQNSFYKHQQDIYKKVIFHLPEFQIVQQTISTRKIKLNHFNDYIGGYGFFKIIITKSAKANLYPLTFFGMGLKTSMGLGQIRLIKN